MQVVRRVKRTPAEGQLGQTPLREFSYLFHPTPLSAAAIAAVKQDHFPPLSPTLIFHRWLCAGADSAILPQKRDYLCLAMSTTLEEAEEGYSACSRQRSNRFKSHNVYLAYSLHDLTHLPLPLSPVDTKAIVKRKLPHPTMTSLNPY